MSTSVNAADLATISCTNKILAFEELQAFDDTEKVQSLQVLLLQLVESCKANLLFTELPERLVRAPLVGVLKKINMSRRIIPGNQAKGVC